IVFFSSRRRHTRSDRDWSSDVCSSDLHDLPPVAGPWTGADEDAHVLALGGVAADPRPESREDGSDLVACRAGGFQHGFKAFAARSEERRVGKEWRCWGGWEA